MYRQLKPIKGRKVKFAVFDIETYQWINPYAVGFFDGENFKEFLGKDCVKKFLEDSIRHKYRGYRVYAHNGGRFDFNFLAEKLKHSDKKIDLLMRGSACVKMSVYHFKNIDDEGKLKYRHCTRFVDSFSLLPYALDKLTKDFNVLHKKLNFMDKPTDKKDFEYLYELYKKNDPRFHNYLRNDCKGLYEVIQKFYTMIEQNNGTVGLTLASTSLNTFKQDCLKHPLKMTSKDLNEEMKLGYYGGRTEIFVMFQPDYKYYCYDVNSLYPYVMKVNDYPISPPMVIKNPTLKTVLENAGISNCKVICPNDIYAPLLPYKYNMKLYFPTGTFTGYWDNALLQKAYELGYKIYPIKSYIFETAPIFKEYVDRFYRMKQNAQSNTAPYIIAKLLLNSLYGKFAQKQESEKIVKIDDKDLDDYEIVDTVDVDYNIFKVKAETKGNHFIPQISIHVTAMSLLHLYSYIEMICNKGHEISYCDTDSIFTDYKLPTGDNLGQMKEEYPYIRGYFLLPKTYCVIVKDKCKVKAKGYIKDFQNNLHESSYKKALFKKDYSDFKMESEPAFNGMKSSYRRHGTFISIDKIRKSIKSEYDKRTVTKDYNTIPKNIKDIICQ